jgi:hypothetical protein
MSQALSRTIACRGYLTTTRHSDDVNVDRAERASPYRLYGMTGERDLERSVVNLGLDEEARKTTSSRETP